MGEQENAVFCQECPTFPKQAVATVSITVGTAQAASPTSVDPETHPHSLASKGCKNGAGLAAKAKAAVLSGRLTTELELFGWQIEFGVSGYLLSVGAEAMIGVFPDEGFTAKASVGAGLFGDGFSCSLIIPNWQAAFYIFQ